MEIYKLKRMDQTSEPGLVFSSEMLTRDQKEPTGCCSDCRNGCTEIMAECGKIKEIIGNINCGENCARCCSAEKIKSKFPITKWLPSYRIPQLEGDIIAGLTVGLTVIPQGLAYAVVAELPPQYGLYSAFMGCFIYCFLGTSKDITLGPTAIMSLMTATFCAYTHYPDTLTDAEKAELQAYFNPIMAVVLSLFSGILQFLMGIFHIGFLVDFISHPVINSFTTAAAITIGCSQIKKWLGLHNIPREFTHQIIELCKHLPETNIWDFVLGLVCMIILYIMKRVKQIKWENEPRNRCEKVLRTSLWLISTARNAIVIGIATLLVVLLAKFSSIEGVDDNKVFTLTGNITAGLPMPSLPKFSGSYTINHNVTYTTVVNETVAYVNGSNTTSYDVTNTPTIETFTLTTKQLFSDIGSGFVIAPLIGLVETIAIGKAFARVNKYKIEANQELIAIGVSNIAGSFVSAYPVTGSFSRTAVNSQSGVKTPAGGIFTGALVMIALALLTQVFYYIPQSALAGVIIMAVIDMIDFQLVKTLWRVKKIDLIPWFATFIFSLALGIEYGIIIGVAISLLLLLAPWNRPGISIVKSEDPEAVRNYGAISKPAVIVEVEQGLRFPGIDYLRQKILIASETETGHKSVILDMRHVMSLDFSAVHGLEEILFEFHEMPDAHLVLTNCKDSVLDVIKAHRLNKCRVYASNEDALHALNHGLNDVNDVIDEQTPLNINRDESEVKVEGNGSPNGGANSHA